MSSLYPWERLYEEAVLETDRSKLAGRIKAAQLAIDARLNKLSFEDYGLRDERTAIADAICGLNVLRRDTQQNTTLQG
jgi:hypothetical protein